MFSITDLIKTCPTIEIIDIGAMTLGGKLDSYHQLVQKGIAHIIGFEPDVTECEKLKAIMGDSHSFYPYFVGKGGPATYYKTNNNATGSLFKPNDKLLIQFNRLLELTLLEEEIPVETVRLDDIEDIKDIDFIKIDVQGGELDVFQGASKALESASLIQTEISFVELYENQPLFADIDQFLRHKGFQFHTLHTVGKRCYKPVVVNNQPSEGLRQFLWGDAIYIKNPLEFSKLQPDKLLKLAVLLHDVYFSYDLALTCLGEYDKMTATNLASEYYAKLNGQ